MQDIRTLGANYTTLHVATYVGSVTEMLDNPHHKDELFRWGLRPGTMFACGVDFLLRLRPEALAPFQNEFQVSFRDVVVMSNCLFLYVRAFQFEKVIASRFTLPRPTEHLTAGAWPMRPLAKLQLPATAMTARNDLVWKLFCCRSSHTRCVRLRALHLAGAQ